jgi:hypothetical protein
VHQDNIEDIQWVDRPNTRDERFLGLPVQRLGRKPAAIHLASLIHEFLHALIDEKMAGKRFIAQGGKTTLETHGHARSVQQNRGFETFTQKASRDQSINDRDRAFKGYRMECDERFFARIRFNIREDFFLIINQEVSLLVHLFIDGWHISWSIFLTGC